MKGQCALGDWILGIDPSCSMLIAIKENVEYICRSSHLEL